MVKIISWGKDSGSVATRPWNIAETLSILAQIEMATSFWGVIRDMRVQHNDCTLNELALVC